MFKKLKIGSKLLMISLAIGILPAALIGGIAVWQSRVALSEQAFSQLESMRELKRLEILGFLAERRGDMQVLLQMVANLRQNAWQKLQSIQENQLAQVQDYFHTRLNHINILSRTEAVAQAIEQFSEAFEMDGGEAGMTWESIKGMVDPELQHYRKTLGYEDLLLINPEGMIVYTTRQGKDFGADLRNGPLRSSSLGEALERVLAVPRPMLQDFAAYAPAEDRQVMFVLGPIYRFDKLVGILAFRLGADGLNQIFQRRKGMGKSGESYLVGEQKSRISYRSNRQVPGQEEILAMGTEVSGQDVSKALVGESGILWKYSARDKLLVSAYAPLHVKGLHWGLISSIQVEEMLTPKVAGEDNDFFGKYVQQYDFNDLFLIHPEGKIFYSVKRGAEYDTNIIEGLYSDTELGKLVKKVRKSGRLEVSDYAPYEPFGNLPAAFIAQPLLNEQNEPELVVAVQLTVDALDQIMQQRAGLGETGETYLVGEDYLMRSNSFLAPETHSIENSFRSPQRGGAETRSVLLAHAGKSGRLVGRNYLGQEVLSTYAQLEVGDTHWALVAEINTDDETFKPIKHLGMIMGGMMLVGVLLVWLVSLRFTRMLVMPLTQVNTHLKTLAAGELIEQDIAYDGNDEIAELVGSAQRLKDGMESTIAQANAIAAGDYSRKVQLLSERDRLGSALSEMTRTLRQMTDDNVQQNWLKTGLGELNEKMRGVQDIAPLAKNVIEFLARYLDAQIGVFYVYHKEDGEAMLKLTASYAYTRRKGLSGEFRVGEGLVGQAALEGEMIVVSEIPDDYIHVQSGTGNAVPRNIVVLPINYESELKAVVELGRFTPFDNTVLEFLKQAAPGLGIGVYTAESRTRQQELLQQSQAQAEELQSQAEELQVQQEELRQSNEELEERTNELEMQKNAIRTKNEELEQTKQAIEQKAYELELASKYKSEFLANMSHELRTPLNSLLILAQLLSANKGDNLTDKQVEYAKTIHNAGKDLLTLINEILDLSKIEAGKIELSPEEMPLESLRTVYEQRFNHVAEEKGLNFVINIDDSLPATIWNDGQRLQQVITNLLSNAFKFTPQNGTVTLDIRRPAANTPKLPATLKPGMALAISVSDTGIGIAEDKQAAVFEAFQQADGSTSRKYGGTGLGLSISRQLVHLMGGEITVDSVPEEGSTFSLYIPERIAVEGEAPPGASVATAPSRPPSPPKPALRSPSAAKPATPAPASPEPLLPEPKPKPKPKPTPMLPSLRAAAAAESVADDRDNLLAGERALLIVEDDPDFSKLLVELAREKHFKCLLATDGEKGVKLAEEYNPSAIILDIGLPLVDGWTVMERLKENSATRHIPIHCVSGSENDMDARRMGAIGYLLKPVGMTELGNAFKKIEHFLNKRVKNLLVVAEGTERQQTIIKLVDNDTVEPTLAGNAQEALEYLHQVSCDSIILDAGSDSGHDHFQLLEQLQKEEGLTQIPVILYADRELSEVEEERLQRCTEHLVIKSVRSPERLLDEATLFLHQVEGNLPQEQQQMLHMVHNKEAILTGKKVLVVDDDMRNIYSLSAILEEKEIVVTMAKNGRRALEILEEKPDIDIVLMDIMMPEMDGYETMRRIRSQQQFKKLPIIALTAKAMKGDKAKCIEAGANDYLAKPVDADKLLSLMRVWLYR